MDNYSKKYFLLGWKMPLYGSKKSLLLTMVAVKDFINSLNI